MANKELEEDKPDENAVCPALPKSPELKNCRRPDGKKSNEFDFYEIVKEPTGLMHYIDFG